jgi:alkaline phosphatase
MNSLDKLPALGLFAESHMDYEIDRNPAVQPSISQMVTKALELLSAESDNGFFLLIEGSRIDMAGHSNDAGTQYHEVIAYDLAFKTVIEFAEKHGNTFVVASSDHETGGITLGLQLPSELYAPYAWYPEVLLPQTKSTEAMEVLISQGQNISAVVQTYANITLTAAEYAQIAGTPSGGSYLLTDTGTTNEMQ